MLFSDVKLSEFEFPEGLVYKVDQFECFVVVALCNLQDRLTINSLDNFIDSIVIFRVSFQRVKETINILNTIPL